MEELKIFSSSQFGDIRVQQIDGEPWFVAIDVCNALAINNNRDAVARLDKDEKMTVGLTDGHSGKRGGAQSIVMVNEAGMYTLVLSSRKPESKDFKRWITHEVIPSIRKTGGYVYNDEQFLDIYLPQADEATKLLFRTTLGTIRKLTDQAAENQPFVDFANHVSNTDDLITVAEFAKMINGGGISIGRNKLFDWLRENGYVRENREPYQKYVDAGLFKVREVAKESVYGTKIFSQTFVTGKGQLHLTKKLREAFAA